MVKKINTNEFANVKNDAYALVDFSATWCGPCKMIAPVVHELSDEMPEVTFYNVDVDDSPELAQQFGIVSIPALVLLKNGEKVDMAVGFQPKGSIKSFIESKMN